jgi:hypothetical protein
VGEGHNESWDYSTQSSVEDLKVHTHLIGDLLGNAVAAYLEFMQPFPSDEDIWWSDKRRECPHFTVTRVSKELYTIQDRPSLRSGIQSSQWSPWESKVFLHGTQANNSAV